MKGVSFRLIPQLLLLVHDSRTDTFVIDRFSGIRKSVVRVSSGRYGEIIKTDDFKLCCVTQNYIHCGKLVGSIS